MADPSRIRVFGPLARFAAGFAGELSRQGYTSGSARFQIHLMAHLSRWLADEGLASHELDASEVERFLGARRAAGYTTHLTGKAVHPMLTYLRDLGWPQRGLRSHPPDRWRWHSSATAYSGRIEHRFPAKPNAQTGQGDHPGA
jgi:hypothetical protein